MKLSSKRVTSSRSSLKVQEEQTHKETKIPVDYKKILIHNQLNNIGTDVLKRRFQMTPTKRVTKDQIFIPLDNGDEDESVSCRGTMQQYCLKGVDVILRQVHYIRNDKSNMLLITVDNAKRKTDTYSILLTKDVCPFNFKDANAFVIKVIDFQQHLKSMTFKADSKDGKKLWLRSYGINMDSAQILLNSCIEEVERRRFHLGVKKRTEEHNKIKVSTDTLVNMLNIIKASMKVSLTDETQWSITSLERLIQLLLNEITEPLIPYQNQKAIRKPEDIRFNAPNETRKLLNSLAARNKTMLSSLLAHMERLSKYYLIIMSSPRKDLPRIRQNICQRLAPMIFRLQEDLDGDIILSKAIDLLNQTMLSVTGEG